MNSLDLLVKRPKSQQSPKPPCAVKLTTAKASCRLSLLAGLDARVLSRVYGERLLSFTGARELLPRRMQAY